MTLRLHNHEPDHQGVKSAEVTVDSRRLECISEVRTGVHAAGEEENFGIVADSVRDRVAVCPCYRVVYAQHQGHIPRTESVQFDGYKNRAYLS